MSIYLGKNGVRQGPHSIEEVVEFIRKGDFLLSDLAWREGQADWQPIHSLADVVAAVLPPLPSPLENPPPDPVLPPPITPPPLPSSSPPQRGTDMPIAPAPETAKTEGRMVSNKSRIMAIVLCLFLGGFGLHAFYAGRRKQGFVFLSLFLTGLLSTTIASAANSSFMAFVGLLGYLILGIFGLISLYRIAVGTYEDGQGLKITKWL